jgi:hypothetical protein
MNTLTEAQQSYLAGLIDGEGCLSITRFYHPKSANPVYVFRVIITMTSENLIRDWHKITGIGSVFHSVRNQKHAKSHWHDAWQWSIGQSEAYSLLKTIYPFMKLKRDQADTAFEFLALGTARSGKYGKVEKWMTDKREFYYLKMRGQKIIDDPVLVENPTSQLALFD